MTEEQVRAHLVACGYTRADITKGSDGQWVCYILPPFRDGVERGSPRRKPETPAHQTAGVN